MKYPILAIASAWAIVLLVVFSATGLVDFGQYLHPIVAFFSGTISTIAYGAAALVILTIGACSAMSRGGNR